MALDQYIDIYCERMAPGLWAEPLNALTNLSFIIAAFFVWRLARSTGALGWREYMLTGWIAVIGIGSFLFHSFATLWAQFLDVLPILFFQVTFLTLYAERVIGFKAHAKHGLLTVFILLIYGFGQLPDDWLNGSLGYAPALIFLIGLGLWHLIKQKNEKFILLSAALIFIISLTFRSVDMAVCPAFPAGTHFMWHLLNGFVLYLSARAYLVNR